MRILLHEYRAQLSLTLGLGSVKFNLFNFKLCLLAHI
jgi:hypothetical protein